MPRSGSGAYTLPAGNPVVAGTTIEANWANTTLNDVATELTGSLARSGAGGMTGPLRLDAGTSGVPALAFSAETTTGLYRAGTNDVRFAVATVDVQQWTAAGTAITGTATVTGTASATKLIPTGGTATGNGMYLSAANTLGFSTNGVLNMSLDASGNLGVGTASPSVRLDVQGGAINSSSWVSIISGVVTNNALFRAINTGGTLFAGLDNSAGGVAGTGYAGMLWHTGAYPIAFGTSNALRMTLDASGNLGIGTASPGTYGNIVSYKASGSSWVVAVSGANQLYSGITNAGLPSLQSNSDLMFAVGAGFNEAMRLTSTGLGIGTASPGYRLQVVNQGTNSTLAVGATGAGETGRVLLFASSAKTTWMVGAQQNVDNGFEITPSTAAGGTTFSTPSLTISNAGNVYPASGTTTMTDGFIYVPAAAGVPTGAATAVSGRAPIYIDTTNNRIYARVGGTWRYAALI